RDLGVTLVSLRSVEQNGRRGLERTLRTERLTIRPATAADADTTWQFRRLEPVYRWLTGAPADLDAHRALFTEPARLATTAIVEVEGIPGPTLIGDLMLKRE